MTDSQLFSFTESTDEELTAAEAKLGEIAGQIFDGLYTPGIYARLVKEKKLSSATVKMGNEPQFIIIYSRSPLNWLTIEGIASLKRCPMDKICDAAEDLRRHLGCQAIQFVTKLAAMCRVAIKHEFKTIGVLLLKDASAT